MKVPGLTKEEKRKLKEGATLDDIMQSRAQEITKVEETVTNSTQEKVTVLCVRFGERYGREYVERLRNMVARHMSVPYEFVCLTDDQHPITGVRTIYQKNAGYQKGWWHKVHMFDSRLPLRGRILYFDLDVVIHASINKLVTVYQDQFLGIHDFNRQFYSNWQQVNSSVMCWTHGTQSHIWEQYQTNMQEAHRLHGDQDWIWKTSKDRIKFWPREWIMSYKWEIRKKDELTLVDGKRQFRTQQEDTRIHPDCCVTVFHGDPKPQDVTDKFVIDNWR